jgi:hypothetical protein
MREKICLKKLRSRNFSIVFCSKSEMKSTLEFSTPTSHIGLLSINTFVCLKPLKRYSDIKLYHGYFHYEYSQHFENISFPQPSARGILHGEWRMNRFSDRKFLLVYISIYVQELFPLGRIGIPLVYTQFSRILHQGMSLTRRGIIIWFNDKEFLSAFNKPALNLDRLSSYL